MASGTAVAGSRSRCGPAATKSSPSTKFRRRKFPAEIALAYFALRPCNAPRVPPKGCRRFPFWLRHSGGYNVRMRNGPESPQMHGTTVLCVRKENKVVLIADGQVTMGDHVMKHTARKTRRLYNDKVVAGFAGSTADAITLFERFEGKLQEFSGNLQKAAV